MAIKISMIQLIKLIFRWRKLAIFSCVLVIFAAFFLPSYESLNEGNRNYQLGVSYPLELTHKRSLRGDQALTEESESDQVVSVKEHTIGKGESAALAFQTIGLSATDLYRITNASKEIGESLSHLYPGDTLNFGFNQAGELIQLTRPVDELNAFLIEKTASGYQSKMLKKEVNTSYNTVKATIEDNFWNAAIEAGLTPNQIMELAGMYSWDIDFALDIRKGDSFTVLFEEQVVDGEIIGHGRILAAVFNNQGDKLTSIWDPISKSYYDENGQAMKKAFLRAPLDFRRVSSNFNPRRLHPVTGRVKAHRGTDYVAPVGTPIWAAGDGLVMASAYNKYNGHYVVIRHNSTYSTKYLHLTKRSVRKGQRVKQGQTIGTLGGTGRVTGPHLHYEFLVNGVHKNPRTVSLPQATSLKGSAQVNFKEIANGKLSLLTKLNSFK